MFFFKTFIGLLPLCLAQDGLVIDPKNADNGGPGGQFIPLGISDLANNRAFGMSPGDANFDGLRSGIPAQSLPPADFIFSGVQYNFPQYRNSGNDNVLAEGQMLNIKKGRYLSVSILAAAETSIATGTINTTYADNSTASSPILVDPYKNWPYPYGGWITWPYTLTNSTEDPKDYNRSMIFQSVTWLDSSKELVTLQLPNVTSGTSGDPGGEAQETRLHIFAVTLHPAAGTGISLEVQYARSTQMWVEGTNKTQIVEAVINNVGEDWVLANNSVRVSIDSPGLTTVQPGVINRLRPGDQIHVQVGVVNANGTAASTEGPATLEISGAGVPTSHTFNATYGIAHYEATYDSIYSYESPAWFGTSGKYGIFIHWGVYAVPGWGNLGENESYAEWYWWRQNQGPGKKDQTWEYHLDTYGPDVVYDDFIQNFTASVFDPKEWVDLFADAGAQYFVQVSKHHDGYALFDLPANVSNRTSVALAPHRNLLQEIFDAADEHQPHLHKGTYYSLPEWFHPDYKEYGFSQWPGGNATNPYTNVTLPYEGCVPVADYITDIILPEMQTLAAMGTEIMWCDIGGSNMTTQFAAQYFNAAATQGKQVLLNNRCGLPGDFDTPEYARYESVQVRKWESNLGMDPYSYGYNRATPEEAYMTPAAIVTSLVDIVSKNGNLLLDIGPTANGTIIEVEQRNLRIAGAWIKEHAEAIFNTTYWFITPEEGQAVRFTQNSNAFYIATLYPPNGTLVLNAPVPYVEGDEVRVVGGNMSGVVVPSRLLGNGSLEITVSKEVRGADRFAWVFKIGFGGVEESGPGNGSVVVDDNGNGNPDGTNGSRPSGTGSPIATQASSGVGDGRVHAGLCATVAMVSVMLVAFVSWM